MADHHGPINLNVNVNQVNTQTQPGQSQNTSGCLGCLGIIGVLMVVGFIGKAFEASPVLGSLLVAVIVIGVVGVIVGKVNAAQAEKRAAAAAQAAEARAAEIRADIESRAAVDAVGGCMWCGHPESHRAENGYAVHPRDWHTLEVEEAVRMAIGGTAAPAPSTPPSHSIPFQQQPPQPTGPSAAAPPPQPLASSTQRSLHIRRPQRHDRDAELLDQLRYDGSGECQWCGSPTKHRSDTGRAVHPAKFHKAEYEAERDAGGPSTGT